MENTPLKLHTNKPLLTRMYAKVCQQLFVRTKVLVKFSLGMRRVIDDMYIWICIYASQCWK